MRCVVPMGVGAAQDQQRIEAVIGQLRAPEKGSRIAERLPAALWDAMPAPAADKLSSAVRRTFDPDGVLNPGILAPLS